jgi:very-short-patch-repair endonuclease
MPSHRFCIAAARRLRRDSSDAERRLWQRLRNRQLGGYRFRRQAPLGGCVVDFVCIEARLVVELDGGHHLGAALADAERTAYLERGGYRVLRFWNDQVFGETEAVLEAILAMLAVDHVDHVDRDDPRRGLVGDESRSDRDTTIASADGASTPLHIRCEETTP